MKFVQPSKFPLRMYIEDTEERVQALSSDLHMKYHYENNYDTKYKKDDENDVDNLVFIDEEGKPYFPSGIVSIVKASAEGLGFVVDVVYDDEHKELDETINVPEDLVDGITLRDYQLGAIKSCLMYKRGLVHSVTGSGKTNMMIGVCKYLLNSKTDNIIICVPTTQLLHQTYENAIKGGVPEDTIFRYGDGYDIEPDKRVMIATVQTLFRRIDNKSEQLIPWLKEACCLMMDEVQHLSCRTWYTVADSLQTEYLLGFSAEPFYSDKEHMIRDLITRGTLGPILYKVSMKDLIGRGYLSKPCVVSMDSRFEGNVYNIIDWQTVNKTCIIDNVNRNNMIVDVANMLISIGKNPLILIQQLRHGSSLAKQLSLKGNKVAFITGGSLVTIYLEGNIIDKYKDEEGDTNKKFQQGVLDAIVASSVLDEGVDMPALSSVILAGGGKSQLKTVQRIGRGLRPKAGDNTTIIIDFQDRFNLVTNKHAKLRKSVYDRNNIPVYYAKFIEDAKSIINNFCNS